MENNNRPNGQNTPMPGHPEGCRCWGCQGSGMWGCRCGSQGGHGHRLLRLVLIVIVISFVFSLGVKLGELKAQFGGYGYYHLFYGGYPLTIQGGYNTGGYDVMMQPQTGAPTQAPTVLRGSTQTK